jgi:hypothetical protein
MASETEQTRAVWKRRAAGVAMAAVCLLPLVLGAWITPDPAGHGSHTQLGLMPCGFLIATGQPCPTCGMTTAFAHATQGELGTAAVTQPGGLLLCLLAAVGVWIGLHSAVFASRAVEASLGVLRARPLILLAVLLAAAWVYKLVTWPAA